MEIKTKYNIGDTVHMMHENKATSGQIWRVDARAVDVSRAGEPVNPYPSVSYKLTGPNIKSAETNDDWEESQLYPSKEALLASL